VATQFSLSGRVAVVTGASRGLGRSISLGLARAGAHIVGVGRTEEDLGALVSEVKDMGCESIAVPADITKLGEIDRVVDRTLEEFGRVDILVNNAGINIPQPASEVTEEAWDKVMNINLKATFFCSQRIGRVMMEQRHGKIINISSQMALVGYYKRSAYCASKGGVAQITKVLAVEWAPFNINVNSVAPTFVETAMTASMFRDEAFREDVIRRIPMGKLAQPEDVVGAVVYLASPASNFVTGHTLLVDGGWVAW
jgi:NAD(P)-dependent dehydrogenase (short-subunit alcohol dehydrogenase family)